MTKNQYVWSLILALGLTACASPKKHLTLGVKNQGEVVQAEGMAAVTSDLIGTKKAALEDARKNAVEKVVGVLISAQTMVDKAITVQQNILAKTDGYVKDYEVTKEGVESDGIYHTHIRAFVSFQQVRRDLSAANLLAAPAVENPRTAVLIQESVQGMDHPLQDSAGSLTQGLIEQGYSMVDVSALKDKTPGNAEQLMSAQTQNQLAQSSKELGAEILILANVRAESITASELGDLSSFRASGTFKAIKVQSGQVLSVWSGQSSGLDATAYIAAQKALSSLGQAAAKDLGKKIAAELSRQGSVMLTLTQIKSVDQLSDLNEKLKKVTGVSNVYVRGLENATAQIQIKVKDLTVSNLAQQLRKLYPDWQITKQTYETLDLQVQ